MTKESVFENPLIEGSRASKPTDPCILVIFGVTGDLTARKLMPALYNLAKEGQLPLNFSCVGFARRAKNNEEFRLEMKKAVAQYSRSKPLDEEVWNNFAERLFYHQSEFEDSNGYQKLKQRLQEIDQQFHTAGNRIYYLATQPSSFTSIIEKLSEQGLIYPYNEEQTPWSRVIIEKPFGHDLSSALALQKNILQFLDEKQIYRIDHYLGKESVQNLLVFRFSNAIFEALWNQKYIDHIQITVAEDIGIGTRGHFWEETGLLRDMIQNHVMQLLSLIAMEPPVSLAADAIRNEKVKVLQALRPLPKDQIDQFAVRGQYEESFVNGQKVKGYRQEENVHADSNIETFVGLELAIDNWRWAGVPFYVRSGKRLPKRTTEITVVFHQVPNILFLQKQQKHEQNVLSIRIQPNEGIALNMNCKVPGIALPVQPVKMDFKYGNYFGLTPPEAYERLICDCILGDTTLFARGDEVIASWEFITPILEHWKNNPKAPYVYKAGTWGPCEAEKLLHKSARSWRMV